MSSFPAVLRERVVLFSYSWVQTHTHTHTHTKVTFSTQTARPHRPTQTQDQTPTNGMRARVRKFNLRSQAARVVDPMRLSCEVGAHSEAGQTKVARGRFCSVMTSRTLPTISMCPISTGWITCAGTTSGPTTLEFQILLDDESSGVIKMPDVEGDWVLYAPLSPGSSGT